MSTNLEYREIEIQRKRESRWQASDAQRVKERQRARVRDKIQLRYFLVEEQHENFVAAVRKWEMLAATTVKMSGSEKKVQEQVRRFFTKRLTRKFMEVVVVQNNGKEVCKKSVLFCCFFAIRPIVVFPPFSLPLPLSITRFYILFEQTIHIIESFAFSPG